MSVIAQLGVTRKKARLWLFMFYQSKEATLRLSGKKVFLITKHKYVNASMLHWGVATDNKKTSRDQSI